jgi:2-hydroxychromene-2-carboxylate isomerase
LPPVFYFDVGSPYAYLAAHRVERVLGVDVAWQPVLLGGLFRLNGRSSWARGDLDRRRDGIAEIARRAERYGLPPLRWPDPWPSDYLGAMRVATHASREGHAREYALAATSAAFAHGRDLADVEAALDVAAGIGLDRDEARAAIAERELKDELRAATDAAHDRGVFGVPTVALGGELFWGDDRLEEAAVALRTTRD